MSTNVESYEVDEAHEDLKPATTYAASKEISLSKDIDVE